MNPDATMERNDHAALVSPLVRRLRRFSSLCMKLEKEGGNAQDQLCAVSLLRDPLALHTPDGDVTVSLNRPDEIKRDLNALTDARVHFQVRRLASTGMPRYYLCELSGTGPYGSVPHIVRDFYLSPGYPLADWRFAQLMRNGHESFFLRLSPFREQLGGLPGPHREAEAATPDRILALVGDELLSAAWHEEQLPLMLVAGRFLLPWSRFCTELIYLLICCHLYDLRAAACEQPTATLLRGFLEQTYPQPAITALLDRLGRMSGRSLDRLPQDARRLYWEFARATGRFLASTVPWGAPELGMPLGSIIYGNIPRLALLAPILERSRQFNAARRRLEREARRTVRALTA